MPSRIRLDAHAPDRADFDDACDALRRHLVVAYPTDTLYALAVDPRSDAAIQRLYAVKNRPLDRAVPLIAADIAQVEGTVGTLTPLARALGERFWPGPLTILLEAHPRLVPLIHHSSGTVAIRVPAHAVARGLARVAEHPVTATSANRSGTPPPSTATAVIAALNDDVSVVLDAGLTPGGMPSTIVDATRTVPVLVRPGAVPWDRVLESLQ